MPAHSYQCHFSMVLILKIFLSFLLIFHIVNSMAPKLLESANDMVYSSSTAFVPHTWEPPLKHLAMPCPSEQPHWNMREPQQNWMLQLVNHLSYYARAAVTFILLQRHLSWPFILLALAPLPITVFCIRLEGRFCAARFLTQKKRQLKIPSSRC